MLLAVADDCSRIIIYRCNIFKSLQQLCMERLRALVLANKEDIELRKRLHSLSSDAIYETFHNVNEFYAAADETSDDVNLYRSADVMDDELHTTPQ